MVERISSLIGGNSDEGGASQISQVCARLSSATAVLESYRKTKAGKHVERFLDFISDRFLDNGVVEQIQKISQSLSSITRLRSQESEVDLAAKLDKAVERLRYSAVRVLEGDKRTDELMTKSGAIKVDSTDIEAALLTLLNSLSLHVESLRENSLKTLVSSIVFAHCIGLTVYIAIKRASRSS